MMRWRLAPFLAVLLLAGACTGGGDGDAVESTTTEAGGPGTEASTPSTISSVESSTTTSTQEVELTTTSVIGLPNYSVLSRSEEDELVVLVAPGTYGDIDIQNVVGDVVERFAPVNTLHIVDDEAAATLVVAETVTPEEQIVLDEHYLVRLEEGFRMIFVGPFSSVGEVILGS
jgi:hypothetical protein